MEILSQKEIEKYYDRCDFDDECDECKNPEHGSYAVNLTSDECGTECDSYICGKCASQKIPMVREIEEREARAIDEYYSNLEDQTTP